MDLHLGSDSTDRFPNDRLLASTLMLGVWLLSTSANTMIGVDLVVIPNKGLINSLEELAHEKDCIPVSIKNTISGYIFMVVQYYDNQMSHSDMVI